MKKTLVEKESHKKSYLSLPQARGSMEEVGLKFTPKVLHILERPRGNNAHLKLRANQITICKSNELKMLIIY